MIKISVVIPTTAEHHKYIQDAINSVDFEDTEIIVVNDTTEPLIGKVGLNKVIQRKVEEPFGAGKARNLGVDASNGECIVFLDADDYLLPGALEAMWKQYKKTGHIVYGNLIRSDWEARFETREQYCGPILSKTALSDPKRPYCCLIPKEIHYKAGEYNEVMRTWEDIDYEIRCDIVSCADKIEKDIYYYRMNLGKRRKVAENESEKQLARRQMYESHIEYFKGVKTMGCNTCGGRGRDRRKPVTQALGRKEVTLPAVGEDEILLIEYIEPGTSVRNFIGPVTRTRYRFGNSQRRRLKAVGTGRGEVDPDDALQLVQQRTRHHDLFKFTIMDRKTKERKVAPETNEVPEIEEIDFEEQAPEEPAVEETPVVKKEDTEEKMVEAEKIESTVLEEEGAKNVSDFTVAEMREQVKSASQDDIKRWYKQELGSMSPRTTMLDTLDSAMEDEE